jgi:hypothetical protein
MATVNPLAAMSIGSFLPQGCATGAGVCPGAVLVTVALLSFAAPTLAQQASADLGDHPVVLVAGQYGTPTRWFGSAGVLIAPAKPIKPGSSPDSSRAGLVVTGRAGGGGFGLAAGGTALALEGPLLTTGFDALLTLTRTGHAPRGAAADSTYAGVEAGLILMSVRLSAGVAHRTAGPPGLKATIFTWSVGVQIPLGW